MKNSSYSLFNDPSDTESSKTNKNELNKPNNDPNTSKNILKLADDTLNFIDQELTKSYKVTSIGIKPHKLSHNEKVNNKVQKEDAFKTIGESSNYKFK